MASRARSSVAVDQGRSAEVNRALAEAGIYAAGIEAGSDLESVFLELTGEGGSASADGRAQPGDGRMRLVGSQLPPPRSPAGRAGSRWACWRP